MRYSTTLAASALCAAMFCFAIFGAARANEAQTPNPLFLQAQQLAREVASSAASDDVKSSLASRFQSLASEQQQLWQLAGEVDGGSCSGACIDDYNNQVINWQNELQSFNADASAALPQGDAQVTMDNRTGQTLDLYIDNDYHCEALFNLTCTAQTKSGQHTLTAKNGDTAVSSEIITLTAGESYTWTVTSR